MQKYSIETKLFTFILLFTFASLLIVPFIGTASASPVYVAYYNPTSVTNADKISAEHPTTSLLFSAQAQCFIATETAYVTTITVSLWKYGSPQGELSMALCNAYTDSGYWYTNASSILETSGTTYNINTDLTNSEAKYTFQFDQTTQVTDGTHYGYLLYCSDGIYIDAINYVKVGYYSSNVYTDGKHTEYYNGAYQVNLRSPYFTVLGDTALPDPSATPTPAPSTTPTVPTELTTIWATVGSLIGLIVPLMVVVLPAFFGYKFAGAWGFLAGINIGAILAYTILGAATFPLWGIVVILILDALLLFGKVGFHS